MTYDASAALRDQVRGSMKGTLTVNFDEIINPDIIGGGVNFDFSSYVFINLLNGGEWSGVRSQHIPYSNNEKRMDALWQEYFDMIDYSGMQYIRLCVSMTMWEPVNDNDDPMTTDFERGFVFSPKFSEREDAKGSGVGFPDLNYAYLEAFYKLLDHFEERGLYVVLGNWDNGSEALGFCPNNENWLAATDANGKKLGRGNDLNVISLDEYAETFAAIMYHLKVEKGYDCIKGISFYNEPEQLKGGQKTLVDVYNKIAEHLTRLGVREDTLIQAYDGPVFWMAADNGNPNRITNMDKLCGDAMDIIAYHCYLSTIESGQKNEGADVRGTVSTYMIPEGIVLVAVAYYLGTLLDFRREQPARLVRDRALPGEVNLLSLLAGFFALLALVVDVSLIFANMQNAESGEFDVTGLRVEVFADSFWLPVVIVSGVCALVCTALLLMRAKLLKKAKAEQENN